MSKEEAAPQNPAAAQPGEFTMTRVLHAPLHRVWRAWTDPVEVSRWWGPHRFTARVGEMDVRVNGALQIDMRAPDGTIHAMEGTFLEVVDLARLVFVARALGPEGRALFELRTSVTFADRGAGRTQLTVEVAVLSATADAAPHLNGAQAGWSQTLERLANHLGPEAVASAALPTEITFADVSDRELEASLSLDAPPWLVFLAWTRPEHLSQWWGPHGYAVTVEQMDIRSGGVWRITQHAPDGSLHPFSGVYREVAPPKRLVHTQRYERGPWRDTDAVVAVNLTDEGAHTRVNVRLGLPSAQARQGMVPSGYEPGMRESWERLAATLLEMNVPAQTPWPGEIVTSRIFAAPPDRVWRAWTDPQQLARWWGPNGFNTTTREIDVRPGGAWRYVMHGPDGTDYESEIVFAEVERPKRLVYVHTDAPVFRQEVHLDAIPGGMTRVAVRSVFQQTEDVQPYAVEGLGQALGRLASPITGIGAP